MKTRLILIAVITIIGISLFSAFKQSEGSKKYLTMTNNRLSGHLTIINENGLVEIIEIGTATTNPEKNAAIFKKINVELNKLSLKNYKLSFVSGGDVQINYIFEKE
jgi:hypothetical protein